MENVPEILHFLPPPLCAAHPPGGRVTRFGACASPKRAQAEGCSFAEELVTGMAKFSSVAADDEKMTAYALSPVPAALQREIDAFLLHRTATFAARRAGGAVVSVSAEGDKQARSPPL